MPLTPQSAIQTARAVAKADEQELHVEEEVLREKTDARLAANPNANLVVLGASTTPRIPLPPRAGN